MIRHVLATEVTDLAIIQTEGGHYFMGEYRFAIRPLSIAGNQFSWAVFDAEWIHDKEVMEGKTAPPVFQCYMLEVAFDFCRKAIEGEPTKPIGLTWEKAIYGYRNK